MFNFGTAGRRRLRLAARLKPAAVAVLIAMLLGACGSSSSSSTGAATATRAAARISSSVTVKASNGVALPADPDRIVSLSGASTEDLFAVGAGKQVVAVDVYSTYPPDAPRTKLSGFDPNVEAIAKYNPDLVVISGNVDSIESQLASLHIPVLVEPAPANLAGAYDQIDQLGGATGHLSQAAAVVASMRRQVASIVASVKRVSPPPTVYHELDQTYYSASSETFIGQLYSLLGLRNIADKAEKAGAYPQLSSEYIIASDPDLIVLADTVCCGQSYKTVAARPGWSHIAAVEHHDVLAVNDSVASEWGSRIVVFLQQVADEVKRIEAQR
jgi:iron complex transport system substrate-binding protein